MYYHCACLSGKIKQERREKRMQGLNKDNVETIIKAGFDYHQNDKLDDAENLYREALKLDTNNSEAYNLMGVLKLQKGEPELAIEYILKAISINPTDYFYETLFQAYIRNDDYKGIIAHEETVRTLYPDNFSLLFDLALAFKIICAVFSIFSFCSFVGVGNGKLL